MLRKYIVILIVSVSSTILFGHNFIPHHHHATDQSLPGNNATHHHDADENSKDLSHLFSYLIHSAEGFTTINIQSFSNEFSRQLIPWITVLQENFTCSSLLIPPLLYKPPSQHLIYISLHSLSCGLRAPPAFIS